MLVLHGSQPYELSRVRVQVFARHDPRGLGPGRSAGDRCARSDPKADGFSGSR